jgi:hypothetical protein
MRRLVVGVLLVMPSGACGGSRDRAVEVANGDRPLEALTVDVASTRYGNAYWARQSDSNTAVWQAGKAYCEQHAVTDQGQKVNCGSVMAVRYEELARHPERAKAGDLSP